eukprot:12258647-Alexandrium_andersonii.AAC.1
MSQPVQGRGAALRVKARFAIRAGHGEALRVDQGLGRFGQGLRPARYADGKLAWLEGLSNGPLVRFDQQSHCDFPDG